MSRIDRRRFLQGTGVALSLPFLESLATRSAHAGPGDGPPKRLVVFYNVQGHPYPLIRDPQGTSSNYQLNDVFQELVDSNTGQLAGNVSGASPIKLDDFRDQMTVITGMNVQSAADEGGNAHNLAAGHSLVGTAMQPGGNSDDPTQSGGMSVDKLISDRITPASVAFPALHLTQGNPWEICYTGAGDPVDRLTEPDEIAQWLFGDFTNPDQGAVQALRERRQSVLDATTENITWLRSRISASDRHRLDAYLERIQAIEQRINAGIGGESCTPIPGFALARSPFRDSPTPQEFHPYYDRDIGSPALIDTVVEALACDRTRVATLTYSDTNAYYWLRYGSSSAIHPSYPSSDPLYPHAGSSGNWHNDIVHANWPSGTMDPNEPPPPYSTAITGEFLRRVARWEMSQFAYLLHRLEQKEEGDSTLLDNTVVLYLNEFGDGTHSHSDMMYLVAGGGAGAIQTGQWIQSNGAPHNQLLLALLRAFDIDDVDTFGDPQYCGGGPLSGLLA